MAAKIIDMTLWPERLGLLAAFARKNFPGVYDDSSPGDFLDSLGMGVEVGDDGSTIACGGLPMSVTTALGPLSAWAEDEKKVAAVHPTNENDEQSDAATVRHKQDSEAFAAPELAALCAALSVEITVAPALGAFGVVKYMPSTRPKGRLDLSVGNLGSEWVASYGMYPPPMKAVHEVGEYTVTVCEGLRVTGPREGGGLLEIGIELDGSVTENTGTLGESYKALSEIITTLIIGEDGGD